MSGGVHDVAARGFAAAADAYERGRPDYPADAVEVIVRELDLRPGRELLELGAGTGKLTRLLVPSGARIRAIEPVASMRAQLVVRAQGVEVIDATAEAIPLPAASVDAVVAAQAFHWFDADRALAEMHRVLRPGGRVALAWNVRDESVAWVRHLGEWMHSLEPDAPQVSDERWRDAIAACPLFGPWSTATVRHGQWLDRDGVVDRVASISYVAAADPEIREHVLASVRSMLDTDPETAGQELVELPYTTEVMWAERRDEDTIGDPALQ